jgi:hypothetical protein
MGILVSKSTTAVVTFSSPQEIIISHLDDSIRIGDGTDLANVTGAGALQTDSSATTQPISVASLPLPSGAATAAKQDTGNTSLASIDSKLTSPITVTGPLTDAQLRASAVPVSAASLPLPTGAATESTLSIVSTNTGAVNTSGIQTTITVTTTPTIAKVGGSNLSGRRLLMIQAQTGTIRHGYIGITSTTGFELTKKQYMAHAIGPDLDYYLVAESGSVDVFISEAK